MNNKILGIALVSLVVGALIGVAATKAMTDDKVTEKVTTETPATNTDPHSDMNHEMVMTDMAETMRGMNTEMAADLETKTGDAFDQAFIKDMIVHHEGAVAMAQVALKNAKHQEIKDMANEIISAQNKEIEMMKQWEKAWFNQ